MIKLSLPFEAVGEARPRVIVQRGGSVRAFSPKSKKREELRRLIIASYNGIPLKDAVQVDIKCFFKLPKSWSKKKKQEYNGKLKKTRPDIDNILKFILDAGNGLLWEDDNLISQVSISKLYAYESSIELEMRGLQ